MNVLTTILYIILFVVFLSILIIIHELGHLTMAKVFKVYCLEFSIGMGPLLFKHKRKNGETQFSLRAIPFGGYVSMYGEEAVDENSELQIDKSRALSSIKKWKRAIIMCAGVFMNLILAIVIFFVSAWIPRNVVYTDMFTVDAVAAEKVSLPEGSYGFYSEEISSSVITFDTAAVAHWNNGTEDTEVAALLDYTNFSFKKTSFVNYLGFYLKSYRELDDGSKALTILKENEIDISKVDYVTCTFRLIDENTTNYEDMTPVTVTIHPVFDEKKEVYSYEDTGIKAYTGKIRCSGIGEAFQTTFRNFGDAATIVVKSLGMLVSQPSSWSDAGGIIAVGFVTSQTLNDLGWNYFLYMWGVISVNLAILNILPFPGLDGWHLLVIIIEGITRKEIPAKVKTIVSFIGIAILFALMILLVFKDLFAYVFHIGVSLL